MRVEIAKGVRLSKHLPLTEAETMRRRNRLLIEQCTTRELLFAEAICRLLLSKLGGRNGKV